MYMYALNYDNYSCLKAIKIINMENSTQLLDDVVHWSEPERAPNIYIILNSEICYTYISCMYIRINLCM